MYKINVKQHFDAAHFLRGYSGRCENLHGHRFEVGVSIRSDKLNETGMVYDFTELKKHLNDVLADYDHSCLNDKPPFDSVNPSSENIAATIYDRLQNKIGDSQKIYSVQVWESPDAYVTYRPD
ncbi:MAG: 6-carboxytetrahydropterin synthase QueD [Chloroflexi bacterium]|nr:6-carboxytetrahydropterin synthase QueD [Chloroflexota bacterium]